MNNFMKSVYAGIVIGLGGVVYLSVDNKIIGSFLFSIGLYSVLVFGFNLFTGKVCMKKNFLKPDVLLLVLLGNFVGTMIVGIFSNSKVKETAHVLMVNKYDKPVGRLLVDGILCGICIAIAVYGYQRAEGAGKYLAVILGVMVFICAGTEHVVADMYYAVAAGMNLRALLVILVVMIGNTIGGILFSFI